MSSDKIDKELHQPENSQVQPVKTIDPTSEDKTQKQPQNKSLTQAKIIDEQKVQESKVEQNSNVEEKKEQQQIEQHKTKDQIIRQYIKSHKIQITNDELNSFIKQESAKSNPFEPSHLTLWIQSHKANEKQQEHKQQQPKSKSEINHEQQIKNEEKTKKEQKTNNEVKVQLTNKQIIDNFFKKLQTQQIKQIQSDILQALNKQLNSRLEINNQTFQLFLKSGTNKILDNFKQWLTKHEQVLVEEWNQKFSNSVVSKQIEIHLNKLKSIIDLADQNKSHLNINIGAGQNKGKTALKIGMLLKQTQQTKFYLLIQVKIKKKVQLRHFIQNKIKKLNKSDEFGLFKFCKIKFEQTQKSLKIQLSSQVFETYVFNHFIEFLQNKFNNGQNPILKAQIQVNVKNSIRQDENLIQNKRFIKWLAEGFTKWIKIQGNNKVVQHFSSPLAQYFPIFKVIRSGEVSLKLKKIQNVDKLFDKLGINQICQQTPTLQKYLQVMVKQHLDSNIVIWVGDIIKFILLFACNIPNQRISIDVNINISHLLLYLNISAQACKELGELVSKTNLQQFS